MGEGDEKSSSPWSEALSLPASMRKLAAKTAAMCGVVALHALLYMSLAHMNLFSASSGTSLYTPLPLGDAILLLAWSVVMAAIGGVIVDFALRGAAERLSKVDREKVPGPFDDALLAYLQMLTQTT